MGRVIQEIRREQGQATRDRILQSTAALLQDASPATLSMPAVAKAAGVSVRTLYVHFPNKQALYDELHDWADQRVNQGLEMQQPTSARDVETFVRSLVGNLVRNRVAVEALQTSSIGRQITERFRGSRRKRIEYVTAKLLEDLDAGDRRRVNAICNVLTNSSAVRTMEENWDMDEDEIAETMAWAVNTVVTRAKRSGVGGSQR
jgi:AcrR family transcriptional regulator